MKYTTIKIAVITIITLFLPYILTLIMTGTSERIKKMDMGGVIIIVSEGDSETRIDLESYLIGVVAAQIPADYEVEALKAQAVIARTVALKAIDNLKKDEVRADELGQDYLSSIKMQELWGYDVYTNFMPKLENAIYATRGESMHYMGELIEAVFHSINTGKTRNAYDAWGYEIPYLVSVDSSYDIESKDFMSITVHAVSEITDIIKENSQDRNFDIFENNFFESIQVIERDSEGYIKSIQVGTQTLTGEEFKKLLNLESTCIYIEDFEGNVRLISKGIGHGVGLSQFGANNMAGNDKSYENILKHYFTGVEIVKDNFSN